MALGLQVRDSSGVTTFDTTSATWLQVDQFTVAANATVENTYSSLAGFNLIAQQQMIGTPANDQESYAPKITIGTVSNQASITVTPHSGQSSVSVIVIVLAQG